MYINIWKFLAIGSKEELEDLKKYYLQYEGDMNKISECFMSYDVNEEDHYREILTELIKKKEIADFPKFSKETKSKRNARVKKVSTYLKFYFHILSWRNLMYPGLIL